MVGGFDQILMYTGFASVLSSGAAVAGLFVVQRRTRLTATHRTRLLAPGIFVLASTAMVIDTVLEAPKIASIGMFLIGAGGGGLRRMSTEPFCTTCASTRRSGGRLGRNMTNRRVFLHVAPLLLLLALCVSSVVAQAPSPEFMSLESAKAVLQKMGPDSGSHLSTAISSQEWFAWLQNSDSNIRQRLIAGEEDSLTNLLRFGVSFTKEYRIDDDYLVRYGQSSLVNAFAENRADDLIKALAAPNGNQGFAEMRVFVEKKGFSLNPAAQRKKLKA